MAIRIDTRTQEEIANSLAQSLPKGRLFQSAGIDGSNTRRLLKGLAIEIGRLESKFADEIYENYFINEGQDGLLEEWEEILGIPDTCFSTEFKTRAERVAQVVAKLKMQYVVTAQDFDEFATDLGFTITIEPAIESGVFPMIFPFPLGSPKSLRFTMIVHLESSLEPEGFPYTFPFTFTDDSTNLIVCLFNKLKPANTNIIYVYDL